MWYTRSNLASANKKFMYNTRYQKHYPSRGAGVHSPFRPKKPVRSFQDLEVYQKALQAAVAVATHVYPPLAASQKAKKKTPAPPAYPFLDDMLKLSLDIPRLIAEAHSLRFDFADKAIIMLERSRFCCNRMIVYLEQIRDIYAAAVDRVKIEEITKIYGYNRTKIFRLAAAWKKWAAEKK